MTLQIKLKLKSFEKKVLRTISRPDLTTHEIAEEKHGNKGNYQSIFKYIIISYT